MSKVYNKIVQSNTEPSKNDIWLKDGQMKTFGKEGWKPVGGKTTESYSPHYVLEYTEEPNAYKDKYEELLSIFTNQSNGESQYPNILLAYYPERYSGGYSKLDYYRVIDGTIDLVFNIHEDQESSHSDHPFIGKIKITITSRYSTVEKIPNTESYIFEYSDDLKDIGLDRFIELAEAISSGKKIIIEHRFQHITPMITTSKEGAFDSGITFHFVSYIPGEGDYLYSVSIASSDYTVGTSKHLLNYQ